MMRPKATLNLCFSLLLASLVLKACSDRPNRARFPGPPGQTTDFRQAQSQQEVMGATDSFSRQVEEKSNEGAKGGSRAAKISGSISLSPSLTLPEDYVLFISARRPEGGPPVAALRIPNATLPYAFEITSSDAMIPGSTLSGELIITATIDQDADPLTRQSGDASGFLDAKVGDTNLSIVINRRYD